MPRVIWMFVALWIIATLSFFLSRAVPGGPFENLLRLGANIRDQRMQAAGLNEPLIEQYLTYMQGLLRFDFGTSLTTTDLPVAQLLGSGLAVSISVALPALFLGLSIGTLAALYAAMNHSAARGLRIAIAFGLAVPVFVTGPLLSLIFAVQLGWLPVAGTLDGGAGYVLPVIVLATPLCAMTCLLLLDALRERMSAPDILAARAKGLSEARLVVGHALAAASLPVLNFLAPTVALTLAGSVVVETLFDLPGSGRLFVQAALARDFPVVVATATVLGAFVVVLNLMADALITWIDPRSTTGGLD